MKKLLYLSLFAFCLPFMSNAQAIQKSDLVEMNRKVFREAVSLNDFGTATLSMHQLIQLEPENKAWQDSLCILYFSQQAYEQAIIYGRRILEEDKKKTTIMELVAVSEQAVGLKKQALQRYQTLYGLTGNIFHLYEMATIQYNLKMFPEAGVAFQNLLTHKDLDKEVIRLTVGQGQTQEVPLEAAVYNLRGVWNLEQKKYDDAEADFKMSLEKAAAFVLPQNNLKRVVELKSGKTE